jgi:hypothetical protein
MHPPLILKALLGLLLTLAIPGSLAAFVIAGLKLRSEGGTNYQASGGFLKWLFWGAFLLTIPGTSAWLVQENIPGAGQLTAAAVSTVYTNGIEKVVTDFVNDFLVGHIVPVVAASLIFKAILDHSEGRSPLGSTVAAIFLLGVQGLYNIATGNWMTSDTGAYATTDMLMNAFNYAAGTISPIVGGLAVSAGILAFAQNKPWKHYVAAGIGFLSVTGIWALVKNWTGVTL